MMMDAGIFFSYSGIGYPLKCLKWQPLNNHKVITDIKKKDAKTASLIFVAGSGIALGDEGDALHSKEPGHHANDIRRESCARERRRHNLEVVPCDKKRHPRLWMSL